MIIATLLQPQPDNTYRQALPKISEEIPADIRPVTGGGKTLCINKLLNYRFNIFVLLRARGGTSCHVITL